MTTKNRFDQRRIRHAYRVALMTDWALRELFWLSVPRPTHIWKGETP